MKSQPNLFFRPDTIFGACKGAADDLGINPLFLRVPLASLILISPELALGIYAALCVVVFASRMLFPVQTVKAAVAAPVEAAPVTAEAANEERELAAAA